jgi:hypothetical protein
MTIVCWPARYKIFQQENVFGVHIRDMNERVNKRKSTGGLPGFEKGVED